MMKLELNHEGAEALRTFANALPLALDSIGADTQELGNKYAQLADSLGIRAEIFGEMIRQIRSAQELAVEALEALPSRMYDVANQIDAFVNNPPTIIG